MWSRSGSVKTETSGGRTLGEVLVVETGLVVVQTGPTDVPGGWNGKT